jgi:hypothetical protein
MASAEIKEKTEPLPKLAEAPEELQQIFRSLWEYHNDGYYKSHKLIGLFSPVQDDDAELGLELFQNEMAQTISTICKNYLVRLHPRQRAEEYAGCEIDGRRDMWELVCSDQITDDHVLLSFFSTAQMTPKMLFGTEPTLIYAFKAYPEGCTGEKEERIWGMLERLKASYQNKEKIIVPNTPEELWECVAGLCAEEGQEGSEYEE